jgi:hypothetical protein
MEVLDEIKMLFSDSEIESAYLLKSIESAYPAWIVRFDDMSFGVAIPYKGEAVNEKFANVFFYSSYIMIEGKNEEYLLLTSSLEKTRNEFAIFCESFVSPGEKGEIRKSLCDDPIGWWKRWKSLIGNSIVDKRPYAVLGEMLTYYYLLKQKKMVAWGGPNASSHDIITDSEEYEIKSTLKRYDKVVHISGQFQLQNSSKRLWLYFCRFEQNSNGISINDMVERLVNSGILREEINRKLQLLGYGEGNSARNEKYQIHEILKYPVDDYFPKIKKIENVNKKGRLLIHAETPL